MKLTLLRSAAVLLALVFIHATAIRFNPKKSTKTALGITVRPQHQEGKEHISHQLKELSKEAESKYNVQDHSTVRKETKSESLEKTPFDTEQYTGVHHPNWSPSNGQGGDENPYAASNQRVCCSGGGLSKPVIMLEGACTRQGGIASPNTATCDENLAGAARLPPIAQDQLHKGDNMNDALKRAVPGYPGLPGPNGVNPGMEKLGKTLARAGLEELGHPKTGRYGYEDRLERYEDGKRPPLMQGMLGSAAV